MELKAGLAQLEPRKSTNIRILPLFGEEESAREKSQQ